MAEQSPNQAANPASSGLRDTALGVLLLLVLLMFYWPAIHGGLVFDDDRLITMESLRSLHGLWQIWFSPPPKFSYYPVFHTVMWLENRIWGVTPVYYHLANLLQHAAAACLVAVIMKRLALPGAWLAAFIFALHPVNVESVAWISEQKNTLSTVFFLAALLAWLRFDAGRRVWWYAAATLLFTLAVLSKTTAATLPGVVLVIQWWRTGRLDWKRDVLPVLPWFAAGVAFGVLSGGIEREGYDVRSSEFMLSPVQHLLLACRELWFYAAKLAWPAGLMFNYPRWDVNAAVWWQWLYPLGALAVAAALCLLARRSRAPLAAFLFFAGNLLPVMGFLYIDWFMFSFVADHFQYVATLGIIVPVAVAVALAAGKARAAGRWAIRVAAGILVFTLSALSWKQCQMYRDMETFYQVMTHSNPGSGMAHYNYGLVLLKVPGRLSEALGQMDEALRLRPGDVKLKDQIARIFLDTGRTQDALDALNESVAIDPDDAFAHYLLGGVLSQLPERRAEAIVHLETSVRLKPDEAQTHIALANALLATPGRAQEAIGQYQEALRINPVLSEAHAMLGNAFAAMPGRGQDAIAQYQESLQLRSDVAEVHYWLANALAPLPGRKQEAIVEYEEALRLRPGMKEVRDKLRELQGGN